jgi:hypothetical protein
VGSGSEVAANEQVKVAAYESFVALDLNAVHDNYSCVIGTRSDKHYTAYT